MQPSRWQTVRSGFWGVREWWSDERGVSHQRYAGWLQGLSFLVVCREGRGIGAVVDALWGECGIGAVVDAVE